MIALKTQMHVLIHSKHLVGIETVLVASGVEILDAHLSQFCGGPQPAHFQD